MSDSVVLFVAKLIGVQKTVPPRGMKLQFKPHEPTRELMVVDTSGEDVGVLGLPMALLVRTLMDGGYPVWGQMEPVGDDYSLMSVRLPEL